MSTVEYTFAKFLYNFQVDEFVERVSRTTSALYDDPDGLFDAAPLITAFESSIAQLWGLNEKVEREIARVEKALKKAEESSQVRWEDVGGVLGNGLESMQLLATGINSVATKIVHVGDQLEGINAKRDRSIEAQQLMKHFDTFNHEDGHLLEPFDDDMLREDEEGEAQGQPMNASVVSGTKLRMDTEVLHQAADVIQKLQYIVTELPPEEFTIARRRILLVYDFIEAELFEEMQLNFGKVADMKGCAHTLYTFSLKTYNKAVDWFIAKFVSLERPKDAFNIFNNILTICNKANAMIQEVFRSPNAVMLAFVQHIMKTVLKDHVDLMLKTTKTYLDTFHQLYKAARGMVHKMFGSFDIGGDAALEYKLLDSAFHDFLEIHIVMEVEALHTSFANLLDQYYEGIGHVKRSIAKDLGADKPHVSTFMGVSAPAFMRKNDRQDDEMEDGDPLETLLSHDVTVSMLQESKKCILRCMDVANPSDLPDWVCKIFTQLLDALGMEHINYALVLALHKLPPKKPKTEPVVHFFRVINDTNSIFYLMQKHFQESIMPAVRPSPTLYPQVIRSKNDIMELIESQLTIGLESAITSIVEWVKVLLTRDQQKNDFRPAEDDFEAINRPCTQACANVVKFLRDQLNHIQSAINGKNYEIVMRELGSQFHQALLAHIKTFTFNTVGGMLLSRDLNMYETCVSEMSDPLVVELFVTLRELTYLLIVKPENLRDVCDEGRLVTIDKATITSFVMLRGDYKTAKLNNIFK